MVLKRSELKDVKCFRYSGLIIQSVFSNKLRTKSKIINNVPALPEKLKSCKFDYCSAK